MMNFSVFDGQPVTYGLSEKKDGPMNPVRNSPPLGPEGALRAGEISNGMNSLNQQRAKNRRNFLEKSGLTGQLVLPRLEHGNKVVLINKDNTSENFQADSLITKEKGILLGVTVADCFPVYFFDSIVGAVGIAHCGWRGIVKNIVPETIGAFQKNFGSKPENILLAIGSGLRFCHFIVQEDVIGQFAGYELFIEKGESGYQIDLEKIIHWQAMKAGVRIVEASGLPSASVGGGGCTFENENYFSYRRDKPEQVQSMLAYIGLR